uniref:Uncharacterized protein n=1 Tax=Rhizophora mucronata TaxID=61149 RepID=A0A2P2IL01_RHIMU
MEKIEQKVKKEEGDFAGFRWMLMHRWD